MSKAFENRRAYVRGEASSVKTSLMPINKYWLSVRQLNGAIKRELSQMMAALLL